MVKIISKVIISEIIVVGFACFVFAKSDMVVKNNAGSNIASISPSGTVKDRSGKIVGNIDSTGYSRNAYNSSLGSIDKFGAIRNSSRNIVGKIDKNGDLWNSNNSHIGKVQGCTVKVNSVVIDFNGCNSFSDQKIMIAYVFFFLGV